METIERQHKKRERERKKHREMQKQRYRDRQISIHHVGALSTRGEEEKGGEMIRGAWEERRRRGKHARKEKAREEVRRSGAEQRGE